MATEPTTTVEKMDYNGAEITLTLIDQNPDDGEKYRVDVTFGDPGDSVEYHGNFWGHKKAREEGIKVADDMVTGTGRWNISDDLEALFDQVDREEEELTQGYLLNL